MSTQHEIKAAVDAFEKNLKEFRDSTDKELNEIKKGSATAEIKVELEKRGSQLDKLEKDIEEKFAAFQRSHAALTVKEGELSENEKKYQGLMQKYLREGILSEGEKSEAKSLMGQMNFPGTEAKLLSAISLADGGYTVRPEISAMIGKKIFESSPVRQEAGQISIATDSFEELYDNDEPTAGWADELASQSETASSVLKKIAIPVHELRAMPKATLKILEDSGINIEAWHAEKVAAKFARDEATAFVTGNGVARPKGFLSYTAGDGFDKIEQVASTSDGAVTADSLIELQNTLLEDFQPGAIWMLNRSVMTAIRKLKDGENRHLFSLDGSLAEGFTAAILGKRVRYAADMPVAASGALSVAYGDFKQGYLIVDRLGISVLRDPYTEKGKMVFFTRKRVGGGVRQFQAIKLLKLATSL